MQKESFDDRLATCLKTVRINKTNNNYKEVKNEQTKTNRNTAKRLAR